MIQAFRALRPVPARAAQVSAPPYDVVDRAEAKAMAQGNPLSFLRVSRPEIELPESADAHSPEVYERARANLERIRREAPLELEDSPSLYVYRLRMGPQEQTGVVGVFPIEAYRSGAIAKHELTRQDKEDDRTRHILALKAQTGPVFLAYRGTPGIDAAVARAVAGPALYDFTAADGVSHVLWRVAEPAALAREFSRVARFYIADGHHRAAAAARASEDLGRSGGTFLAVAFPAEQLRILPYHRVVRDLGGMTAEQFLDRLVPVFEASDDTTARPARGEFSLFLAEPKGARWRRLRPRAAPEPGTLDVSLLQNLVLAPILGIRDPRTDSRIEFVGGIRGTAELEARVRSGRAAAAFALHPTSMDDLMAVADTGGIMPPKSTWFEPKLRDGLFSHLL